ncbi:MAG: response regulator [Rickettsiales bacterium]
MDYEKSHILVIDDDDRLRLLLSKYLTDQGFMVTSAASAYEARKKMVAFTFDILVLDIMMPEETGSEFIMSLDKERPPVLMLSAMSEAEDRINGLEMGAEDYLTKPFEPKELVLRIRAILRRTLSNQEKTQMAIFGNFSFDLTNLRLTKDDEIVYLTSNESLMLKALAEQAGNPVSRDELSGINTGSGGERSIDVQMSRLRKKIEENDSKPLYLQTVRGAGYVLYAQLRSNI